MKAIDLGLSVKWADCNVGANRPEESGYYFSNTKVKPNFLFWKDKYNINNINLDSGYYIPTDKEWIELLNNCNWVWDESIKGYFIKSKINDNSIFLPAAGYREKKNLYFYGLDGNYWSNSLSVSSNGYSKYIGFDFEGISLGYHRNYYGLSVRLVLPNN